MVKGGVVSIDLSKFSILKCTTLPKGKGKYFKNIDRYDESMEGCIENFNDR